MYQRQGFNTPGLLSGFSSSTVKSQWRNYNHYCNKFAMLLIFRFLTLFRLGFLRVAQLGGGGGWKVPAAYNSKTINDNEMKPGGVVKNH